MIIEIPGYKTLGLDYLVLDYNGTIAVDGLIPPAIKERLLLLGDSFKIYVLTADTHGTAAAMCDGLPLEIMTFPVYVELLLFFLLLAFFLLLMQFLLLKIQPNSLQYSNHINHQIPTLHPFFLESLC